MTTLQQEHKRDACYFGENGHWLIACSVHRDSDALARSNFASMEAALEALPAVRDWAGDEAPVTIERSGHWAVGWVDYLVINPECVEAVQEAERLRARLEDYPILDEEHFSTEEMEEANEVWRLGYNERERIAYIRAHRRQFEFAGFADLLSCVRGNFFAGYACELLH